MSAPTSSQIGYKKETTWGVHATPDHFVPLLTADLSYEPARLESEGVVAGLDIIGSEQWNGGNVTAGGNVGHELYAAGMGVLYELMFGSGSGGVYKPTTGELPSATIQVGRARPGGAVLPENWVGAKVADWSLACSQGAIATLGLGFTAKTATFGSRSVASVGTTSGSAAITATGLTQADTGKLITGTGIPAGTSILSVTDATHATMTATASATGTVTVVLGAALATATYGTAAAKPLKFNHASLDLAGSAVAVTQVTISGKNGLSTDRRFLGSQLISEPLREGRREFTATVGKEFLSHDHVSSLINGDEAALVLSFATADAAYSNVIEGNVRWDKASSKPDTKKIAGEDLDLKFVLPAGSTDLGDAIKATIVEV